MVGGSRVCVRVCLNSGDTRVYDVPLIRVRMVVLLVLLVVFLAMLPLCIGEGGRVICGVNLPLVSRRRELTRVVHIVSMSIVIRQRGLDAWIPPERSALNGRRSVDGNNVRYGAHEMGDLGEKRREPNSIKSGKGRMQAPRKAREGQQSKCLSQLGEKNGREKRKRDLATLGLPCSQWVSGKDNGGEWLLIN